MSNTTFTTTTTQPTELIPAFAEFLNYPLKKIENETHTEFVARMAKIHNEQFVTQFANHRIHTAIETYKANLEQQILTPLENSVEVTFETVL